MADLQTMKATDHPLLGQLLIEAGLTRYGREPGRLPEKPIGARAVAQLAFLLERAEHCFNQMLDVSEFCGPNWAEGLDQDVIKEVTAEEDSIRLRYREAKDKYADAVYAGVDYKKYQLENSKRVPKSSDKIALETAKYEAERRVDLINDMRPHFASAREVIDANAALMLADHAFGVAKTKFQDASLLERRTGIRPRSRPNLRLVTDGYLTTGRYKVIDGQRVPVVEKVR
jgi:hypothetical protein